MMRISSKALRLSAVVLGVGLLMAAGAARAGDDDEEDDKTFEEKIIEGIMKGLGATNMDNSSIDYRERSPLVVPPKLDLPPPASAADEKTAPNWPKDPDEARRKAAIAARKKDKKYPRDVTMKLEQDSRPLTPSELNAVRTKPGSDVQNADSLKPGDAGGTVLSPSQLGYEGGFMGLFKGNKTESTEFKQEPARESLVQPPPGYQTPSPQYPYGTGPMEPLNKEYDPARGKYGD